MSSASRLWVPVVVFTTVAVLAGCAPGSGGGSGPDGTTQNGGGDASHDDPFAPEPPTTGDGWKDRYEDAPWLSDDLDNDDFFITGTVDGHAMMGIYCADDGNGTGSILSVDDATTTLELQSPTDFDVLIDRGGNVAFTGIGTYSLPSDPQGTHPISFSFDTAMEYNGTTEQGSSSSAAVSLEALGVPYPDPTTCRTEQDELFSWASSAGGH